MATLKICPNCGRKTSILLNKFCSLCGTAYPKPKPETPEIPPKVSPSSYDYGAEYNQGLDVLHDHRARIEALEDEAEAALDRIKALENACRPLWYHPYPFCPPCPRYPEITYYTADTGTA